MIVYHYASVETGLNILKSIVSPEKSISYDDVYLVLRATHTSFMNDPEDSSILDLALKDCVLDQADLSAAIKRVGRPFSISFCGSGDNLNMWRSYADKAKGLALGFDTTIMNRKIMTVNGDNPTLSFSEITKCNYLSINEVKEIVKSDEEFKDYLLEDNDGHHNLLPLERMIQRLQPMIKDKAYEGENEYRMAVYGYTINDYFCRNGLIVPFTEIKIPFQALKRLVIGPASDYKHNALALHQILHKYSGQKVEIMKSEINYCG